MSERLLAALRNNPTAKAGELPDTEVWANRFAGRAVKLKPDESFVDQIMSLANALAFDGEAFNACYWQPYDEGYDDGPGEVSDNWRSEHRISTGQFEGWVVDTHKNVFDPISASVACAICDNDWNYDADGREEIRDTFIEALSSEWHGPRSREERDKALGEKILELASQMSPAAVKGIVELLRDW